MSEAVRSVIGKLAAGDSPTNGEVTSAFEAILQGEAEPALIAAFLMGLRMRGETVEEIVSGVRVLRSHARTVTAPAGAVDTCGTGGLGWTSLNTSTASALVAAGAGAIVAKHGNRSVPPKTGSADVLEALGVNLAMSDEQIAACFDKAGVAFLFAPAHHSAMRHVAPVRKALGIRTIFNFLGPLSNPAGATRQVLGVFGREWVEPYAEALLRLGASRAWVVHGLDGLDELSTSGTSLVAEVKDGAIRTFELEPEGVGLPRTPLDALRGGTPEENAAAIRKLLDGDDGPFADLVAFNAAATLVVAEIASDIGDGVARARDSIASGAARTALENIVATSNG
ncbi:MAG: anthranilate phosphoribosyltransferase [Hyphomonadaceae bacterium]